MIKMVAFDLVGVLVSEKDIELTKIEDRLERMFGSNISDDDYFIEAKKIKNDVSKDFIMQLITKIYEVKDKCIFKKIKDKNNDLKIIIATNHISLVEKFIFDSYEKEYLDDIIISAEIHKVKPNLDFYNYILTKYNLKPNELLFLDDNYDNIMSANSLGINTIKVSKDTNLLQEIEKWL